METVKAPREPRENLPSTEIDDRSFEVTKDVSNNLGDLFKKAKADTAQGTKVQKREDQLKEALAIVKEVTEDLSLAQARVKYQQLLEIFYSGKELEKQLIMMNNRRTVREIVTSAWHIYIGREEYLNKLKKELEEMLS